MHTGSAKNKLTLWLDRDTIALGKDFAKKNRKSLSQVIHDYLWSLKTGATDSVVELTPRVQRMSGIVGTKTFDMKDYHKHLEKKYRHG